MPQTRTDATTRTVGRTARLLAAALLLAPLFSPGAGLPAPAFAQDAGTPPVPAPEADPLLGPRPGESLPGGPPPAADGGVAPGFPASREGMWPAPTDADWEKPCLITFQRTWEDAVAVARETNKALLICISMDGEVASENWAGKRYRDPAVAALYEPYVCVIASVYRHTSRDHDDAGNRILCPRFGSVTCGEHISIEPILFERYLDGVRVAPRHIMVELDGKETYDVYYANDTESVSAAIRRGIVERKAKPEPVTRGDRPLIERVGSRDVVDRVAVENGYREGDEEMRRALLDASRRAAGADPIDLLRLALFGTDPDAAKRAREALAATNSPAAVSLIAEVLRGSLESSEREALLAALTRLSGKSDKARWVSVVNRGLSGRSEVLDPSKWVKGGSSYGEAAPPETLAEALPDDAATPLEAAEAYLARAIDTRNSTQENERVSEAFAQLLLTDARRFALRAEAAGDTSWRVDAVLCIASYALGDRAEGYARAEKAVKSIPADDASWNSWRVLTIFGEARWKAIQVEVTAKRDWPPQWLADLNAAYSILRRHPVANDGQIAWHYELLAWLGAKDQALAVVRDGLERWPASEALHAKYRARLLEDGGGEALEKGYADFLRKQSDHDAALLFAARASIEAAEALRRMRRGRDAMESYDRAEERFERAARKDKENKLWFDRAVALIHAARARVFMMTGDEKSALESILASYKRGPAAAGDRDGLGITPGETGQMLLSRLQVAKNEQGAARLKAVLDSLDQELLRPDRP
jgi:tetratricopeptide (TPR) repeat protein